MDIDNIFNRERGVNSNEKKNAKDQESQVCEDGKSDEGSQSRQAEVGQRQEGHESEAGDRDRSQGVGSEQVAEEQQSAGQQEQSSQPQEEVGGRQLLARQIRVYLKDGQFVDLGVTVPWLTWLNQMFQWGGIVFEDGYLPRDFIKAITPKPLAPDTEMKFDNVVPLKR